LHPHNRQVGEKLGLATLFMVTLPFVAFYGALHIFSEKDEPVSWAGGAAIIVTNGVVAGYVYMALTEKDIIVGADGVERFEDPDKNVNDEAGPRVGFYKKRTD
jgi:hypothetical protein